MIKPNEDIANGVKAMREGGIILYPTETVWGIGCDATDAEAVKRIYRLKERLDKKSMIVLVDSIASLERTVENIPEAAEQLIEAAVRPLTIIYDHARNLPECLVADDGSIGVRITSGKTAAALCRALRRPIVSTSANISGHPAPRTLGQIDKAIIDGVDYIVGKDTPEAGCGRPSEIIKVSDSGVISIIRS